MFNLPWQGILFYLLMSVPLAVYSAVMDFSILETIGFIVVFFVAKGLYDWAERKWP